MVSDTRDKLFEFLPEPGVPLSQQFFDITIAVRREGVFHNTFVKGTPISFVKSVGFFFGINEFFALQADENSVSVVIRTRSSFNIVGCFYIVVYFPVEDRVGVVCQ